MRNQTSLPEIQYRWPNLFLIGAPKCGTTAMSHYLARHPQIYMSEEAGVKEPRYFSRDINQPWGVKSTEDYMRLFENAPVDIPYWGEASPDYLISKVAVGHIIEINPDARFVVMVRNPMDLAYSAFRQHVKHHYEIFSDFSLAWNAQADRLYRGLYMPPGHQDAKVFQYGEIAKTGGQVARLFDAVVREQVHVIVFDDLERDSKAEYVKLLGFLGLEYDGRDDFSVMNRAREYRLPIVQKILTRIAVWRRRLHIPGGWGINAFVDRFNAVENISKSASLPEELRAEMTEYFREDVALLGSLLDRDLSHWLDMK